MTYPDGRVAEWLNTLFVPVQVDIEKASKLADRWQAMWTPNLNMIDGRERRFYHVTGYLPPSEFAAMLQISRAWFFKRRKKFDEAAGLFKDVVEQFPRSIFAPEALYFRGVSRYLSSHEVEELREDWVQVQRFYPHSQWALKSNV